MDEEKYIAQKIRYPEEWDTAAYPTLVSALWERYVWELADKNIIRATAERMNDIINDLECFDAEINTILDRLQDVETFSIDARMALVEHGKKIRELEEQVAK